MPGFTLAKFNGRVRARWRRAGAWTWEVIDARAKPNVLILVSTADHCLNDLLYRQRIGSLNMNVPAIVSNHLTCAWLADRHGIPYYHLPTDRDGKEATEARILELVETQKIDLVVLARYMQILSTDLSAKLAGQAASTSTTPSCRASRARSPTRRRSIAA